jgi:cytochrome c553
VLLRTGRRAPARRLLAEGLGDFKQGTRMGYGNAIMPEVAAALNETDLKDLAQCLANFRQ